MSSLLDDEWNNFLTNPETKQYNNIGLCENSNTEEIPVSDINQVVPKCQDLYISTTTKVLFLNQPIDIQDIYWKIPIIDYWKPEEGILKKQIKIVSTTKEDFELYQTKLNNIKYYNETIIKQIDNPEARRIKFKDERKITIGMSKKDIMTCRGKVKNAFYNCFALIIRFKLDNVFREIHVKVFNTGKLEIPGVLNDDMLHTVKRMILELLVPYTNKNLVFLYHDIESNVLINSNFNCGFYINRDKLQSIMRSSKYNIETAYDPCSYPGVKCKFYFNNDFGFNTTEQLGQIVDTDRKMKMSELDDTKKYTEISFMIFRTGSCLIVGNCTKRILVFVYDFIKQLLYDEYYNICVQTPNTAIKIKKEKVRKKTIVLTNDYYNEIMQ
tara:strand:+ start:6615 stop:7763 length:1149 start_codon:yes stop_codon:yes gene_type:complete